MTQVPSAPKRISAAELSVAIMSLPQPIALGLIENGAPLDEVDVNGNTALMIAAMQGKTEIIEAMVKKGADPNQRGGRGMTALMVARNVPTAEKLLELGADISIRGEFNRTALTNPISNNLEDASRLIDFYIEKGCLDFSTPSGSGWGGLMAAAKGENLAICEKLIAAGAQVNEVNGGGSTPLHIAALYDCAETIELLAKHGAYMEARTNDMHDTPLLYACRYVSLKAIQALVKCGADVHARDKAGHTVMDVLEMSTVNVSREKVAMAIACVQAGLDDKNRKSRTLEGYASTQASVKKLAKMKINPR